MDAESRLDGVEIRLARLEAHTEGLERRLDRLEQRLDGKADRRRVPWWGVFLTVVVVAQALWAVWHIQAILRL